MYVIENDELTISVNETGAEVSRIYSAKNNLEYLWSGDPEFWGKYSPVLFPIVGALKQNLYYFKGKSYSLPRHGFAREKVFQVKEISKDSILLSLGHDGDTLKHYPFLFEFQVRYSLRQNILSTEYLVTNKGGETMFFSLGAHPAFRVPLVNGTEYDDYYLLLGEKQTLERWPISKDGLIETVPETILRSGDRLPLKKSLFMRDALVFKEAQLRRLSLRSDKTPHGIEFTLSGFPYLGIWAAKNADFVCIEPWCGIADSVDTDQQLHTKEGIEQIGADELFKRGWEIRFF